MKSVFPLKLNDKGLKVVEAQKYLKKAGSKIEPNGVYTIGMVSAVRAFQKKNGLKVTGRIDKATFEKLSAVKASRKK